MAKKDYTFVRFDVAEFDLELAVDDLPTGDDWLFIIPDWLDRGYKISLTTNSEHGGTCVTLTGKETGTDDDGYVMSAWGKSVESCVSKLFYLTDFVAGKVGFMAGKKQADIVHDQRLREIREMYGKK